MLATAYPVIENGVATQHLTIEDVLKLLEDALGTSENAALREALGVGVGAASGGDGDERMEG